MHRRILPTAALATLLLTACGSSSERDTRSTDVVDTVDALCEEAALAADASDPEIADALRDLLDEVDATERPSGLDEGAADALDDMIDTLDAAIEEFEELTGDGETIEYWTAGPGAAALDAFEEASDEFGARSCERLANDLPEPGGALPDDTTAEAPPITLELPDTAPPTPDTAPPPVDTSFGFATGLPQVALPAGFQFLPYDEQDDEAVTAYLEGTTLAGNLDALFTGVIAGDDGVGFGRLFVGIDEPTMADEWLTASCLTNSESFTTPAGVTGVGCVGAELQFFSVLSESVGFSFWWDPTTTDGLAFFDAFLASL